MLCPSCRAEVFHVSNSALKARTRILVVRGDALALACPECRVDVPIGRLDAHTAALMEVERRDLDARQRAS